MNTIKRKDILLLTAFLMLVSAAGYGQMSNTALGGTNFGVRAGVNFQNLNGKDGDGDKLENRMTTGFHVGVHAEIPVAADFYVQPGLLWSTKGARGEESELTDDVKVQLSYLEIPVNFLYKPVLGQGRLLLGVGPYFAIGVGGKLKMGDMERNIEWEKEITAAQAISGTPYFRRSDAGANLLFGYELSNGLSAQLNAQLGLTNINPEVEGADDNSTLKNTGFGISLGYRF